MGFPEDIYRLGSQVSTRKEYCKGNEEATKHSLILPFFQILGYDIHDPSVLVPEFKAGFASNKEKIDYAIFLGGKPVLFVEAKAIGEKLENYDAQLAKYFNSAPDLKLATITNGIRYKFFTDLQKPNMLDPEPFFEFDLEQITPEEIRTLEDFRADSFNSSSLVTKAENLVYLRSLKKKFRSLFRDPSEEFVRFIAKDIFLGKMTEKVLERLTPLVREAMSVVLVEMVSQGLSQEIAKPDEANVVIPAAEPQSEEKGKIETTEEELAAFQIVCNLIAESMGDAQGVAYKDTVNYFGIHFEKRTKWFMRLVLSTPNKHAVVRIPAAQAMALLGEGRRVDAISPDTCKVFVGNIEDLAAIREAILAAYRMVMAVPVEM